MNTSIDIFLDLSKTEQNLKKFYLEHPERNLDSPHNEEEIIDVLNCCYSSDSTRIGSFASIIDEQAFIPENMDIAFVKHMRYTPAFWHTHEFFELLCAIKGRCRNIFEDTEIVMVPGDICIHSPGTTHTVCAFDDDSVLINILMRRTTFENNFLALMHNDSVLSNFFNRAFFNTTDIPYLIFHTKDDKNIEKYILDAYIESKSLHRYRKEMVNAQISQLIIYMLQKYEQNKIDREEYENLLNQLLETIKNQEEYEHFKNNEHSVGILTGVWMVARDLIQKMQDDGFKVDEDIDAFMEAFQERINEKALKVMDKNKGSSDDIAL